MDRARIWARLINLALINLIVDIRSTFKEITFKGYQSEQAHDLILIGPIAIIKPLLLTLMPASCNSISEDVMILGDGLGHFTSDNAEVKERAIGQGMQSCSRLNWTWGEMNYTFGSDYVLQASQKNLWNQYLLSANSKRTGWQDTLRASNTDASQELAGCRCF